ncbi:hypothetical protein [Bacteroides sp. 224]|uniref:hypothetical protein n=1 Tax=Bacteroides sp. 224 TaxID=2302936 RepID=UPI0013D615B5|nr:hypothetical protein [Bacteroides sp. 224]NDV64120.1 hypothetical protein [Bacteroides sp. 224]
MNIKCLLCGVFLITHTITAGASHPVSERISASISLKVPGNQAKQYPLTLQKSLNDNTYYLETSEKIPVTISQSLEKDNGKLRTTVSVTATEDIYFNFSQLLATGFRHDDCQFYMPGFWYRRNLRSPKSAPSFHTSDSWIVREDRLSAPLTGIFSENGKQFITVNRVDPFMTCALSTHREGEIILSGDNSLGFTGFENKNGVAALSFGFPYHEAPKSYIRKLTLAPEVTAFQYLKKGESILLTWEIFEGKADDYSDFVRRTWEYCYDTYSPKPVNTPYSIPNMKETLSQYFVNSLVDKHPLVYNSGAHLHIDQCAQNGRAEVGFIGRVLLNAFNALEYGMETNRDELKANSYKVFDSYLKHGFTNAGFFKEWVNFDNNNSEESVLSIRRQSEGVYAMFHFLTYEKEHGRRHPEWEQRLKKMLDMFMQLQNADGSFPRKFRDDFTIVDKSGGSTPSATLPLVMGYKYFKDKRYLASAKRTADYLEKELISKADYFSSTLDANCEDKEASLYAATATYYLALITKGEEQKHYADLTKKASYFALSWYYVWDVPFAPGQMLGDIGLKTRGWGNVSVENNHIDVFIFEFADVLRWLSKEYKEPRFSEFAEVISTSMRQLLPHEGHLCGIAKTGYYPEVVQHTIWDYGKNGKGYYNDIFAPGWTVASLWELFTPGRAEVFLAK